MTLPLDASNPSGSHQRAAQSTSQCQAGAELRAARARQEAGSNAQMAFEAALQQAHQRPGGAAAQRPGPATPPGGVRKAAGPHDSRDARSARDTDDARDVQDTDAAQDARDALGAHGAHSAHSVQESRQTRETPEARETAPAQPPRGSVLPASLHALPSPAWLPEPAAPQDAAPMLTLEVSGQRGMAEPAPPPAAPPSRGGPVEPELLEHARRLAAEPPPAADAAPWVLALSGTGLPIDSLVLQRTAAGERLLRLRADDPRDAQALAPHLRRLQQRLAGHGVLLLPADGEDGAP